MKTPTKNHSLKSLISTVVTTSSNKIINNNQDAHSGNNKDLDKRETSENRSIIGTVLNDKNATTRQLIYKNKNILTELEQTKKDKSELENKLNSLQQNYNLLKQKYTQLYFKNKCYSLEFSLYENSRDHTYLTQCFLKQFEIDKNKFLRESDDTNQFIKKLDQYQNKYIKKVFLSSDQFSEAKLKQNLEKEKKNRQMLQQENFVLKEEIEKLKNQVQIQYLQTESYMKQQLIQLQYENHKLKEQMENIKHDFQNETQKLNRIRSVVEPKIFDPRCSFGPMRKKY